MTVLGQRTDQLNKLSSVTPFILLLAIVIAIVISVLSYARVTRDVNEKSRLQQALEDKEREITSRIRMIEAMTAGLSAGRYGSRIDDKGSDELASISRALNKMAEALQDSFSRLSDNEWLQTGLSRLNRSVIGEKGLAALAQDALSFTAVYTGSQVGALYVLEHGALSLQSGFALNGAPRTIAMGEGLAGQAAMNDEVLWLRDVDRDYITVTHATGKMRPCHILVVPVRYEDKVKGVIELGSVHPYSPRAVEFVKAGAGNIGIVINRAQNRLRLQELLEETQAQSEELQAQHSELENLNAELEVHAQKLQASEEELRAQLEELQQTNAELEERNAIISERNADIQQKAAELEQSTRYKSEFMANISHELRTPLNSILLLSRYLAENTEKNLSSEQIESVNVILSSGHGLLSLIDEMLDLSKIEAGKMELDYQRVAVDELLKSIHSLFAPMAEEKGLRLTVDNELPPGYAFDTDSMRLEQILKNLLSNALKFTSEGSVGLLVRKKEGRLEFVVSDTGIGIPADKLGLVFDAFRQADGSTRRKFGGTGLGLSISQELAHLLGGTITVTSELSRGSRFVVTLPQERTVAEPAAVPPPEAEAQRPADIPGGKYLAPVIPDPVEDDRAGIGRDDRVLLIIEDDTAFARILLRFCRRNGYKGIVAVRGDQGVSLARQYQPAAAVQSRINSLSRRGF
jgi:signal transduction histidine kinase